MPIIKSAKKRVRVSNKAAIRNSKTKRSLKTALKSFTAATGSKSKDAGIALSKFQSEIDKATKKGIMHKNKAARKQAQAARAAKAAGVKPAGAEKKVVVKPAVKKSVPAKKATPAKTPAVKAVPAKKAAAKKPATKK